MNRKIFVLLSVLAMSAPPVAVAQDLAEVLTGAKEWSGEWRSNRCFGTAILVFENGDSGLSGRVTGGRFGRCGSWTDYPVKTGSITGVEIDGNTITFVSPSGSDFELEWESGDKTLSGSGRTSSGIAFRAEYIPSYD